MAVTTLADILVDTEQERVERWRKDTLEFAGYPEEVAVALATMSDVDLHIACGLLEHGCPLDVALAILT